MKYLDSPGLAQVLNSISGKLESGEGCGGTSSHPDLTGRDLDDQHPVSAISGLQTALDTLQGGLDGIVIPPPADLSPYRTSTQQDIIDGELEDEIEAVDAKLPNQFDANPIPNHSSGGYMMTDIGYANENPMTSEPLPAVVSEIGWWYTDTKTVEKYYTLIPNADKTHVGMATPALFNTAYDTKDELDSHEQDFTNPHKVTAQQAFDEQGNAPVVSNADIFIGYEDESNRLVTKAELVGAASTGRTYFGQIEFLAKTTADRMSIPSLAPYVPTNSICYDAQTAKFHQWDGSAWDSGNAMSGLQAGAYYDALSYYGEWNGKQYSGDVTASVKLRQTLPVVIWDYIVYNDVILDGEIDDAKIGPRQLVDNAGTESLYNVVSRTYTNWLQTVRDMFKGVLALIGRKADTTALDQEIVDRGTAVLGVSTALQTHAANATVHVNATDRTNWDGKVSANDMQSALSNVASAQLSGASWSSGQVLLYTSATGSDSNTGLTINSPLQSLTGVCNVIQKYNLVSVFIMNTDTNVLNLTQSHANVFSGRSVQIRYGIVNVLSAVIFQCGTVVFHSVTLNLQGQANQYANFTVNHGFLFIYNTAIVASLSPLYAGTARSIIEVSTCTVSLLQVTFQTNQNTGALIGGNLRGSIICIHTCTFDTTSTGSVSVGVNSTSADYIVIGNIINKTQNYKAAITPWFSATTEAAAQTNSQNNPGTFYWYPEA